MKYPQIFISSLMISLAACAGSASSPSGIDSSGGTGSDSIVAEGDVRGAFPKELAITSPLADSSQRSAEEEESEEGDNYFEHQNEIDEIVNGESIEECFDFQLPPPMDKNKVDCYGPTLEISGEHPDGDIGEHDLLPHGDLGIWNESTEDGRACLAAKLNEEFRNARRQTDMALMIMASSICVAKNSEMTLPAEGETLDMTDVMAEAIDTYGKGVFEPSSVTLTNLGLSEQGRPIFKFIHEGEVTNDGKVMSVEMSLIHVPLDDSNETYKGTLNQRVTGDFYRTSNCPAGTNTAATSIVYDKSSDSTLSYNFKKAMYCGDAPAEAVFDDKGELNPDSRYAITRNNCNGTLSFNPHGWGDQFTSANIEMDLQTGYADLSYSWQAGRCDQATRVLKADLTSTGGIDGVPGGCGYFGYGPDMTEQEGGQIDGMVCNWAGPGSGRFDEKVFQDLVQRQCVSLDSDSKMFVSDADTLRIAYAPTNNCDNLRETLLCDGEICTVENALLPIEEMDEIDPQEPEVGENDLSPAVN